MKILLISSYELGRQPVHVASPAAALESAGHEVRALDVSLDPLSSADVEWADAVAVSVPMHTAKRLGDDISAEIKQHRPDLPIAHYGLYAGVGDAPSRGLAETVLEGEYEPALVDWVESLSSGSTFAESVRHLGRSDLHIPRRSGLPNLDQYARLEFQETTVLAGAVEASHGCRHRCRHCPIPVVYDGRIRVVPRETVLEDIDQLVDAGARHITFGDADFLNAPAHSIAVLEKAHASHPEITFDATIKVEHILKHREIWPALAARNLLFVISAFESVDSKTLEILDKGHTVDDMSEATELLRTAGIHIRPTWLPFLPWTKTDHVAGIFRFIADNDLAGATDPVQLSIKLLIPEGSLLEDHPAVTPHLRGYDAEALTWGWEFEDQGAALLQKDLEAIAADASECGEEALSTLHSMWRVVTERTGHEVGTIGDSPTPVPRLTESWFCCAEPTTGQSVSLQIN